MNASLLSLEANIKSLRDHIQSLKDTQQVLTTAREMVNPLPLDIDECLTRIAKGATDERLFEYRANIVSLYGAFEHFIEDLIREYVDQIKQYSGGFSGFDKKIKEEYVERWKNLHTNIKKGHAKYGTIDEIMLAKNINDTIVADSNDILAECFIPIGGNYQHKTVSDCMKSLGANQISSLITKYEPLKNYIANHNLADDTEERRDRIFNDLKDLVQRRNEVAHGGSSTTMSENDFNELTDFVIIYAKALNAYMSDEELRHKWDFNSSKPRWTPDRIFNAAQAVSFKVNNTVIRKNCACLVKRSDTFYPRFIQFKVAKLNVDIDGTTQEDVEEVNATSEIIMSISFAPPVTSAFEFMFL